MSSAVRALSSFHLRTSVRVALEVGALQVVGFVVLVGLQPAPGLFLERLAAGLEGSGGFVVAKAAFAAWATSLSFLASRRASLATRGWHRTLQVDGRLQRRALIVGLACAQAPVLVIWLLLWVAASLTEGPGTSHSLAAVPVVALAAAWLAQPPEWGLQRWFGLLGLFLTVSLGWWGILATLLGLAFLDRSSVRPRRRMPSRTKGRAPGGWPWLGSRLAWRALGRGWPGLYLPVGACLGAVWLFLTNNELSPSGEALGVRLGCGLGLATTVVLLSERILQRRPLWPWARSLPRGSRRRLLLDAAFLFGHSLPAVVAALWLAPLQVPALVALALWCSLRCAGAMRGSEPSLTGLGAATIAEVFILAALVAMSGWFALPLALGLPFVLHRATRAEQSQRVSLWIERRHAATGDPLS